MTVANARAWAVEASGHGEGSLPGGVAVEEIEIPGATEAMPARVYRPSTATTRAGTVLWLRGGGFVVGSLATERIPAPLARASECAVVSIEYPLAPEHPFPEALNGCYAALCWVADHAATLAGHASAIAIGGESAGANLAAATALMARDRGGPELALQVLLYPMLARSFDGPSRHDPEMGALIRTEAIDWLWRQYLGDRDSTDPLACPLCAHTLAGLPPAVVMTAEFDVLRDEGEAYAQRLASEGVPIELRRYDGMHHGFAEWPGIIDAADECIDVIGASFGKALATGRGHRSRR
jgi:acetyl esterase